MGLEQPSLGRRQLCWVMPGRHVRQAGLLDRRPRYYAWKITLTALALAAGWAGLPLTARHLNATGRLTRPTAVTAAAAALAQP